MLVVLSVFNPRKLNYFNCRSILFNLVPVHSLLFSIWCTAFLMRTYVIEGVLEIGSGEQYFIVISSAKVEVIALVILAM